MDKLNNTGTTVSERRHWSIKCGYVRNVLHLNGGVGIVEARCFWVHGITATRWLNAECERAQPGATATSF